MKTTFAITALVLAAIGIGASSLPASASAAMPAIKHDYVGSSFMVYNPTAHPITLKYDSDGSGHGSKAQFLTADGSDVTPGVKPVLGVGETATFYVEMRATGNVFTPHEKYLDDDASADLYVINTDSGQTEGKIHIQARQSDNSYSWENWTPTIDGQTMPVVHSKARVGSSDLYDDEAHFSSSLGADTRIDL